MANSLRKAYLVWIGVFCMNEKKLYSKAEKAKKYIYIKRSQQVKLYITHYREMWSVRLGLDLLKLF